MTGTARDVDAERARRATAVVFAVNAIAFGTWVPRVPDVADRLDLSPGQLGVALLGVALGGLPISRATGPVVARLGSRRVTLLGAAALLAWVLPGAAPSQLALLGALVLAGAADAVCDVAMNAHGSTVQRRLGRPVMSGLHGWWSGGAVLGGLIGSGAAALGVPVVAHLALVAAACAPAVVWAGRHLLPAEADRADASSPTVTRASVPLAGVALLVLLGAVVEIAPADWAALWLRRDLGASPGVAGLAFTGFVAAMTVARLLGDRVIARLGATRTLQASGLFCAATSGAALLVGQTWPSLVLLALAGAGAALTFPVAFSASGDSPGLSPGAGVAFVGLVARVGGLVQPLLVGGVAERAGLAVGLAAVPVASLLVAALAAPALRRAAGRT